MFSQRVELVLDLPELLRTTRRYFDATLEVQSRVASEGGIDCVRVMLRAEEHAYEGTFEIQIRLKTPQDLADAQRAEQRGRAAGMSSLAARCPTVWEVHVIGVDSEPARLNLCGILASVALGPILPDDGATLYGVRGAMERVQNLLKSR